MMPLQLKIYNNIRIFILQTLIFNYSVLAILYIISFYKRQLIFTCNLQKWYRIKTFAKS